MVVAKGHALNVLVLLVLAINLQVHAQPPQCTASTSSPKAICFAATARGALNTDCTALNNALTQALGGGAWSGVCSNTPPAPFNGYPVVSPHRVFYSCMTGLSLTAGGGRPAYPTLAPRVWQLSDARSSASLTSSLRNMYSASTVPAALWLSFSCQAPRMPIAAINSAIGRFYSCTGNTGFFLNPPPPIFGPGPEPPPPPSPPDVLGYSRVGCILSGDSTYNQNLAPFNGNPAYGHVPSVQACAATVRTALRLEQENDPEPLGKPYAFGLGPGGYCQAFTAVSNELLLQGTAVPRENGTASWVSDSKCNTPCPLSSPGETCGGSGSGGTMTVYVLGDNTTDAHNGLQECSIVIHSSDDLPPMLALSEIALYDLHGTRINLTAIYGNGSALPEPGNVPYASLSTWYWDLSIPDQPSQVTQQYRVWSTNRCFDGNLETCCGTSSCLHTSCDNSSYPQNDEYSNIGFQGTYYQDLEPTLTVTYPCHGGHTLAALGHIELHTCRPTYGFTEDNQPANINNFQIDYLGANGKQDAATSYFSGPPPSYATAIIINVTGIPPPLPPAPQLPNLPLTPPSPPPPPAGFCWVVIRPTASFAGKKAACNDYTQCAVPLNLAEVQLFGPGGTQLQRSTLQFTLSSTYIWHNGGTTIALSADKCNDGITHGRLRGDNVNPVGDLCRTDNGANIDGSDSNPLDPNPTLSIRYPCPGGSTTLTQLVVYNREDSGQDRINYFTVDFKNQAAVNDAASYTFTGAKLSYNIPVQRTTIPASAFSPPPPRSPPPSPPPLRSPPPSPPPPRPPPPLLLPPSTTGYWCINNTVMAGKNIASAPSTSDQQCAARCAQNASCQWVSRHSDGTCYLKQGYPTPMRGPDGSNSATQMGTHLCLVPAPRDAGFLCVSSFDVTGIELSGTNKFYTPYTNCVQSCKNTPLCDFIMYTGDGLCVLKQKPFSTGSQPGQAGHTTGPVSGTLLACFRTS